MCSFVCLLGWDVCVYEFGEVFFDVDLILDVVCIILDVYMKGIMGLEMYEILLECGLVFFVIFIMVFLFEVMCE